MNNPVKDLLVLMKSDGELCKRIQGASTAQEILSIAADAGFELDKLDCKFMLNMDQNGSLDIASVIDYRISVLESAERM